MIEQVCYGIALLAAVGSVMSFRWTWRRRQLLRVFAYAVREDIVSSRMDRLRNMGDDGYRDTIFGTAGTMRFRMEAKIGPFHGKRDYTLELVVAREWPTGRETVERFIVKGLKYDNRKHRLAKCYGELLEQRLRRHNRLQAS